MLACIFPEQLDVVFKSQTAAKCQVKKLSSTRGIGYPLKVGGGGGGHPDFGLNCKM